MNKLEEILNTSDDSDFGFLVEVDLRYPDNIKDKTENFPFCPEKRVIHKDKHNEYIEKKPKGYKKAKKFLGDWSDKKNYLFHYRMLKFFVRNDMLVDKNVEIISFKQTKWLEK